MDDLPDLEPVALTLNNHGDAASIGNSSAPSSKKIRKRKRRNTQSSVMEVDVADPSLLPRKKTRWEGETDVRKVPVPANRYTPLKETWTKLLQPVVEHLKLQMRFNLKTRNVELRTSPETQDVGALQKGADFVKAFVLGFEVDVVGVSPVDMGPYGQWVSRSWHTSLLPSGFPGRNYLFVEKIHLICEDAMALIRLDDLFMESFEITDVKPLKGDHLGRAVGRIAGKGGRTKFTIENGTKTRIVLADKNIHILGSFQNIQIARTAICSLILGSPPSKVYVKNPRSLVQMALRRKITKKWRTESRPEDTRRLHEILENVVTTSSAGLVPLSSLTRPPSESAPLPFGGTGKLRGICVCLLHWVIVMGMADPWGESDASSQGWDSFDKSAAPDGNGLRRATEFEDSFVQKDYTKLSDSSQYLSVLERKLARLQKKPTNSSSSSDGKDLVRGLSALRADRMANFLDSSSHAVIPNHGEEATSAEPHSEAFISDPLYSSWMMQRLRPDRQALSAEELEELLRFDALALLHEQTLQAAETEERTATGTADTVHSDDESPAQNERREEERD